MSEAYQEIDQCYDCDYKFKPGDEIFYFGGETVDEDMRIMLQDPYFVCKKCHIKMFKES